MIALDAVRFTGHGLNRPECVVAHRSGTLFAPDWTGAGGISIIAPGGRTRRLLATRPGAGVPAALRPNGIALEPGGSVLLAHLGDERGGIYRLWPDGRAEVVVDTVDGAPMPPANFVVRDGAGRLWITVSTTVTPRADDYRPDAASGFVALWDGTRARVVASGLGYTNECLLSGDETRLWVNETFARRLTEFTVTGSGLSAGRTAATFGPGTFPDGMAAAADGSILVTSIVSNRILRVWPGGRVETLLEDADPEHLSTVECAFQAGTMGRPHLDGIRARALRSISNIAFGGPGMRTAYLGCLLGASIASVPMPVAGCAPPHYDFDIGALADAGETI